jgi:luciferase family oxidoreductase group 1
MSVKLSILDLAPIGSDQTASDSFRSSVELARQGERHGYTRVWYAEHHNMSVIASSATSVLIGYVAAHTETIRLGSGGIMLPNHSPLVIAEQFGTLAAMYPGRIDLGLGRAPGSDQVTARALHATAEAAGRFPNDVRELQGYLSGESIVPGVQAIPGKDSHVPLYILGSSLFGAQLAAAFGLPYAFASHFSPAALDAAIATYRAEFKPSEQLDSPYVMAGVNVLATDTLEEAEAQRQAIRRSRAILLYGRRGGSDPREVSDEYADYLLSAGMAAHVDEMMTFTALGTRSDVRTYLDGFIERTGADELIVAHGAPDVSARLHSVELLAEAMSPVLSS